MKRILFILSTLLLAIAALPSCKRVETDVISEDVYTHGATVTVGGVTLEGYISSVIDIETVSEAGFLVSEKSGFSNKSAQRFTTNIPKGGTFTRAITIDELDGKREVTFYYKAYIVDDGELKAGEERSFTTKAIEVTSISLDKAVCGIKVGNTLQLKATVKPDDATHPEVTWTSSNPSVASVSSDGLVKAISKGKVVITAEADGKTATCTIGALGNLPAGAVDLGLSVYWADANVGATEWTQAGEYFKWGEKTAASSYGYADSGTAFPKYDFSDKLTVLESGDDAATANKGKIWRTPSPEEWEELIANCTLSGQMSTSPSRAWVLCQSKANSDNAIRILAGGYKWQNGLTEVGSYGHYMTNKLYKAYNSEYTSDDYYITTQYRFQIASYTLRSSELTQGNRGYGYNVRAVTEGE